MATYLSTVTAQTPFVDFAANVSKMTDAVFNALCDQFNVTGTDRAAKTTGLHAAIIKQRSETANKKAAQAAAVEAQESPARRA